ncbi:MAG: SUMF1/EgtB/PvdO family nonheme iron enzyme [bacterium]
MKAMRMILWLGFALATVVTASATVPVVTNVVASQRTSTKLVDIYYDVSDAEGDLLKISVEVSHAGGQTFNIPASSFTGDYGDNIVTGVNKHIVWDAGRDWDGEYSTQMVIKVTASDARGLPGLQWGNEVPSGGFLMGQEGGAEGYGPSRHVNIPWSHWLSKYEITSAQYSEYLNIALAAGKVQRNGTTNVTGLVGVSSNKPLINLDGTRDVIWNVNAFEAVAGRSNFPVRVTWYGAIAFAQFYSYDLPTDAEWEKATRGPDHAGVDQHQAYPWGNTLANGNANFYDSGDPWETYDYYSPPGRTTPIGYYNGNQTPLGPDMATGYGLYDVAGNVYEWTRSRYVATVESYDQLESLTNSINALTNTANIVVRGGSWLVQSGSYDDLKCYYRRSQPTIARDYSVRSGYGIPDIGFRVIRRSQ